MSDVLTQAQIDALLNSVQTDGNFDNAGGGGAGKPEESRKFRKYDFHTPKKFTKDRLKLLRSVYENYARLLSSHLTSLLRLTCEVELLEIEEQRYYEFSNALADDSLLAFSNVRLEGRKEYAEDPVLVVVSDGAIYAMLDRMLGGTGDNPSFGTYDEESTTVHTDIEVAVYETILEHIVPQMDSVWENYLRINFEYHKIESNPNLIQVMPVDEIVVIVAFSIKIKEASGQISICLPGGVLEAVFRHFEQTTVAGTRKKEAQTKEEKESIMKGIEDSVLTIKAEFEQSTIFLEELYSMSVGDILNLDLPKDSEVNINIGGKPWYKAKLGVYKENIAVKLTGVYKEQQSRSTGGDGNE